MIKFAREIILFSMLFLIGCNQASDELTKEEKEAIYREEVQKQLAEEEKEEEEEVESDDASEEFDALPTDTQIALLTPYYDERGEPDGISEGLWFVRYGLDDSYIFIQVHSGVGSGHPVYMIEREGDTFHPVDGVVSMGVSGYEVIEPPQVTVTVEELIADYENNPDLYDASAANTEPEMFDLATFNELKDLVEESADHSEAGTTEFTEPIPDQPMFIDGVLYSGEAGMASPEQITSAAELRAQGYEVYELTYEEYDSLSRDLNEYGIGYEDLLDHYLSNY